MSRKKSVKRSIVKNLNAENGWIALTWEDMERWAGSRSVSRGRSYQQQGRVHDLAISQEGHLLASVQGGERYVVAVELKGGRKTPVRSNRNAHVRWATVDANTPSPSWPPICKPWPTGNIPLAAPNNRRWEKLTAGVNDQDDYDEDFENGFDDDFEEHDDDDDEEEIDLKVPPARKQTKQTEQSKRHTKIDWDEKIRNHIRQKSPEELADLLDSLVQRYSELREEFREQIALGEGDVNRLVAQARKELRTDFGNRVAESLVGRGAYAGLQRFQASS